MRSYLYVPGDRADRLRKAWRSGADAIICDIEDAVAPSNKATARATIRAFLREVSSPSGNGEQSIGFSVDGTEGSPPEIWVRMNSGPIGWEDLASFAGEASIASLAGVFVPKVASVEELLALDARLRQLESGAGVVVPSLKVIALIETAVGVLDARSIAQGPRVFALALGEADLAADLGVERSPDAAEFLVARSMVVLASAAAGIQAPIGPVSLDFRDEDLLRLSSIALRKMGFGSRSAIHPDQVRVINEVFTPTPETVAEATRLIELFDESVLRGDGVCVDDAGRMVDEAVVRSARRVLSRRPDRG